MQERTTASRPDAPMHRMFEDAIVSPPACQSLAPSTAECLGERRVPLAGRIRATTRTATISELQENRKILDPLLFHHLHAEVHLIQCTHEQ